MKKITAILLFAVLTLGCVFATSGDVVILEVDMDQVKPIYTIHGAMDSATASGVAGINDDATLASATSGVITKTVSDDADTVTLAITIKEHGYKDSDSSEKNYVRIKKNYTLTVTADALKNVDFLSNKDARKTEQGTLKTLAASDVTLEWTDTADHTVSKGTVAADSVQLSSKFLTGKTVTVANATTAGWDIASWNFTWDITNLIGGEKYRADIKLTFQAD